MKPQITQMDTDDSVAVILRAKPKESQTEIPRFTRNDKTCICHCEPLNDSIRGEAIFILHANNIIP